MQIGSIEKMSKSKKNLVDPDDIISSYGADCARCSCCPTAPRARCDLDGSRRRRGQPLHAARLAAGRGSAAQGSAGRQPQAAEFGPEAVSLRRAAHKTLDKVGHNIEGLRSTGRRTDLRVRSRAAIGAWRPRPGMPWAIRKRGTPGPDSARYAALSKNAGSGLDTTPCLRISPGQRWKRPFSLTIR